MPQHTFICFIPYLPYIISRQSQVLQNFASSSSHLAEHTTISSFFDKKDKLRLYQLPFSHVTHSSTRKKPEILCANISVGLDPLYSAINQSLTYSPRVHTNTTQIKRILPAASYSDTKYFYRTLMYRNLATVSSFPPRTYRPLTSYALLYHLVLYGLAVYFFTCFALGQRIFFEKIPS